MLRWFKLIGLRTRAIVVVEREYGRKLSVAGGPDAALFNAMTRRSRDLGGNEYDAAAAFIAADAMIALHNGEDGAVGMFTVIATTMRLIPQMARPDIAEQNLDLAREAAFG